MGEHNKTPIPLPIIIWSFLIIFLGTLTLEWLLINNIFLEGTIFGTAIFLSVQGIMTLVWMLYTWNNPRARSNYSFPKETLLPKYSFSAIIPARNESLVIGDTIAAIGRMNYPSNLKEIIVVVRSDDPATYDTAKAALKKIHNAKAKLVTLIDTYPINKPAQLNQALKAATGEIVCIFDAEDEPHPDMFLKINTLFTTKNVDVVQSAVQLMDHDSSWFSLFNVLEYFFWFKSGLIFFTRFGNVSFLGGNTVFFKREWLDKVGGWDEYVLTEDADIGIRLAAMGAKTKVVYDSIYATKEETPHTVEALIKQRTRWIQGFVQILFKGHFLNLPTLKQKLITLYILLAPIGPLLMLFYIPFGLYIGLTRDFPISLTLFSYIPFYVILLLVVVSVVGYFEFLKAYKLRFNPLQVISLLFYFVPYTFLLSYASLRALQRTFGGNLDWEKTAHLNAHRSRAYTSG